MQAVVRVLALALALCAACVAFRPVARLAPRSARLHAGKELVTHYEELSVTTLSGVSLIDITPQVAEVVKKSEALDGVVTILSKHSTVSVIIQEFEKRFVDDARQFLHQLAPPNKPYLHNDLDFRVGPPGWPGGDEAWRAFRAKEPVNAHSHLLAMVLGTSESVPLSGGAMKIGTYQNIIVVDADGCAPGGNQKKRTIAVQITGSK